MKELKKISLTAIAILLLFVFYPANSQDLNERERPEDFQHVYIEAYGLIDRYPDIKYTYEYDEDGKVTEVNIYGVPDTDQKRKLAMDLVKLEALKRDLRNMQDEAGIYYISETEPEPKEGYRDLYQELHADLKYPETAKEYGVEGTVFVKFIVESDGEVKNITSASNIDTPFDIAKEDMIEEAKKAVKATSGDWIPAKVGNVPVDQWVYLPVKFNLESSDRYTMFNY